MTSIVRRYIAISQNQRVLQNPERKVGKSSALMLREVCLFSTTLSSLCFSHCLVPVPRESAPPPLITGVTTVSLLTSFLRSLILLTLSISCLCAGSWLITASGTMTPLRYAILKGWRMWREERCEKERLIPKSAKIIS